MSDATDPPISLPVVFLFPLSVAPSAPHQDPQRVIQPPLALQVHTSLTKPKEQMMRPTQTQPSSTQRGDKTTPRKRKSTSSRAALVPVRCPTVDGYYWPYLNATKTVILEVATSLCLFFFKEKKANVWRAVRPGRSGICCVKIFLVKYTLLFDTSVRLGFLFL